MWILTSEVNEYDQHGKYFEYAWESRPSKEAFLAYFDKEHEDNKLTRENVEYVYDFGGKRFSSEWKWFSFREFKG